VAMAVRYAREGVDGIALFTDETVYSGGLDDLMFVSRAVRVPVVSQDYILEEYQVVEARAAGASAVVLSASVLDSATLRAMVSATQRNRMTAIVEVTNREQLEQVTTFSPQVVALNSTDPETHEVNVELMCSLRPLIPHQTSVMISCGLTTLEEVAAVVKVGVHAVLISEHLLSRTDTMLRLKTLLKHPFQDNAE
jgi:indole-3-glycerol phosphate synthase